MTALKPEMFDDLSNRDTPVTDLFKTPATAEAWNQYRLDEDQIEFFLTHGYLAGIGMHDDEQIETLRAELSELIDPNRPGQHLFYEFHSNESANPAMVRLAPLGAWRTAP